MGSTPRFPGYREVPAFTDGPYARVWNGRARADERLGQTGRGGGRCSASNAKLTASKAQNHRLQRQSVDGDLVAKELPKVTGPTEMQVTIRNDKFEEQLQTMAACSPSISGPLGDQAWRARHALNGGD